MNATLALPRPRRSRLGATLFDRDVQDGAFAALILGSRIPANLGMAGGLACLVLTALYVTMRPAQARDALWRGRWQLAFPVVALLSVLWAVHPAVTLRAAVQMSLTAFAGLMLAQAARPRAVLIGVFAAYAGYTVASFLVGNTRPDGIAGTLALYGIGGEAKNYFADTSATAALLAMTMVAAGIERRSAPWTALCLACLAICVLATLRAHSAGAVASLAAAGSLLAVLLLMRGHSGTVKLALVGTSVVVLLLGAAFSDPLMALVQELSAKDTGLTGRGYLWYRADFIIAQRPWLGMGYFGFWTSANPDAVGLWRHFDIRQEGTAFSFHNGFIQTLVENGYIGLSVLVATWAIGVLALMRRFVLTPSLPTCFWLGYLALQFCKVPVEPVRPAALIAPTIMLFAALGFGSFPLVTRRAGKRTA